MEFVCVVKDIQKEFVSVVQDTLDIGNCYILTLQYYIGNGSKVRMLFVTNGLQVKIPYLTNGPQVEIVELGARLQNNVASSACASFSNGFASRPIAYFSTKQIRVIGLSRHRVSRQ